MGTSEKVVIFITVFVVFVIFAFLAWYFSHKAKHKERLLLIEKGIDIDKLVTERNSKFPWLKLAIVVLGISAGLLLIAALAKNGLLRGSGTLPLSILGICGGVSLVLAHYLDKKNR